MVKSYLRRFIYFYKIPFYFLGMNAARKRLIFMDVNRWVHKSLEDITHWDVFDQLVKNKNFASVYNYRFDHVLLRKVKNFVFPYNWNIEINTKRIGGGLMVLHNFGCVISANSLGENCTVSQGVTIGNGGGREETNGINKPTIGNNVMITTNSVVIGNITIGDNAIIGACSLINKDVPPNAVVVGNPQRVIRIES